MADIDDFEVVRFDPTRGEEPEVANDEAKILAKLKKKIEKRKLEENAEEEAQPESKKKMKKKKHKGQPQEPTEETLENKDPAAAAKEEEQGKENESPASTEGGKSSKNSKKQKGMVARKDSVNFMPLGQDLQKKKKKVFRVLPHWLLNPDVAEIDYLAKQLPVQDMEGLDSYLTNRLQKLGFKHFFPVQRQIIPILLKPHMFRPHDVCVSAPTGSGKTLAFVLPIIQSLKSRIVPKVRAVVVLPTVDLVQQVFKVFQIFADGTGLKVKSMTGQTGMKKEQSGLFRLADTGILHQLADILVVTPGRLVRHIRESKQLDLTALRYLVIDEADRMIMNISFDWLNVLESAVFSNGRPRPGPLNLANIRKRELPLQKLLFSATLGQDPEKLEQINLFEPKLFRCIVPPKDLDGKIEDYGAEDVGEYSIPAELTQYCVSSELAHKPLMVKCIIDKLEVDSVLVFTKSRESTHRLALVLSSLGYSCGELTKDMREERKKMLNKLKSGAIKVLVCSDALARGIDIENLTAVISYDCPEFINTYIHRVGRTARAGREGTSVTILEPSQAKSFRKMISSAGLATVPSLVVEKAELEQDMPRYHQALEMAKQTLIQEQQDLMDKNENKRKIKHCHGSKTGE